MTFEQFFDKHLKMASESAAASDSREADSDDATDNKSDDPSDRNDRKPSATVTFRCCALLCAAVQYAAEREIACRRFLHYSPVRQRCRRLRLDRFHRRRRRPPLP